MAAMGGMAQGPMPQPPMDPAMMGMPPGPAAPPAGGPGMAPPPMDPMAGGIMPPPTATPLNGAGAAPGTAVDLDGLEAVVRIRQRHPEATEEEVRLRLASLWFDRETMIRVFHWDPEERGLG